MQLTNHRVGIGNAKKIDEMNLSILQRLTLIATLGVETQQNQYEYGQQ